MKHRPSNRGSVLMVAYTHYINDPRVIREAEAAVAAGMQVDFLALRREGDPEEEQINGVRVIHLNQRRYRGKGVAQYMLSYWEFFLRCLVKMTFLGFKRKYQVVHVNNMPDFLVFSAILLKLQGAKVILDIHDPMPNTFASKFKRGDKGFFFQLLLWQERLSARFADCVVTVHDPVKDLILVKHGLPADSIKVIANFADDQLFKPQPDYDPNGKLRLIFHGTILERYGLRTLIEALSKMQNRDQVSVKIIGEGDFSKTLQELILANGLGRSVEFTNRVFPLHQIPQIIAGYNLGLVPLEISSITNYALPLKMLEYISMGLPVITTRNAAIGYYFGEDDCLFYKANDAGSLCAVLDRVATDRDLLLRYHRKALVLREKFLWSHESRKYIDLLHELQGIRSPQSSSQTAYGVR